MKPLHGTWRGLETFSHRSFLCGYCGEKTGTKEGYFTQPSAAFARLCGGCNRLSFFEGDKQVPPPRMGATIGSLPPGGVAELYDELRACVSARAFTAAVTIARTLLAHVAVDKGADEGKSFAFYVDWLEKSGFTTSPMKPWVDHIRDQANVSAHELKVMDQPEATRSLAFVEMLLRIVYEFPAAVPP